MGNEAAQYGEERLNSGLASLPPGRTISWSMGVANAVFQPALQLSYTVTINASGPFGPLEPLTYTIDLNDIKWSRVAAATGTLYGVTRAVKDLGKTIKEITKNRPATDLADHKDHGDDREHDH